MYHSGSEQSAAIHPHRRGGPTDDPRPLLLGLAHAGLESVKGEQAVKSALAQQALPEGPIWIAAIGKAAPSMTEGALAVLGERCQGGLLVTKVGHADPQGFERAGIEVWFAGHPLPDAASLAAGRRLLESLDQLSAETQVLCLLSGGASALIEVPIPGLGLAELQAINRWLLGSGLPISAINRVRQAISQIKGGGLLSHLKGRRIRQLAISDVPGDRPELIGSGPLVPVTDLAAALQSLVLPPWLRSWIEQGLAGRPPLPPTGPRFELVASSAQAQEAIAASACAQGLPVWQSPTPLTGDAAETGRRLARQLMAGSPGIYLWGGETTVRLPERPGRGGRNQHLALAAAIELAGDPDCWLLCLGTDGTDGPTEDAGALVDGQTVERGELAGLDACRCLERCDAGRFLEASGDLIHTGPTGTNVMDLIIGYRR